MYGQGGGEPSARNKALETREEGRAGHAEPDQANSTKGLGQALSNPLAPPFDVIGTGRITEWLMEQIGEWMGSSGRYDPHTLGQATARHEHERLCRVNHQAQARETRIIPTARRQLKPRAAGGWVVHGGRKDGKQTVGCWPKGRQATSALPAAAALKERRESTSALWEGCRPSSHAMCLSGGGGGGCHAGAHGGGGSGGRGATALQDKGNETSLSQPGEKSQFPPQSSALHRPRHARPLCSAAPCMFTAWLAARVVQPSPHGRGPREVLPGRHRAVPHTAHPSPGLTISGLLCTSAHCSRKGTPSWLMGLEGLFLNAAVSSDRHWSDSCRDAGGAGGRRMGTEATRARRSGAFMGRQPSNSNQRLKTPRLPHTRRHHLVEGVGAGLLAGGQSDVGLSLVQRIKHGQPARRREQGGGRGTSRCGS